MKYEIKGGAFPVVVCYLDNGETMITEKGSMVWQTPNMMMSTTGGGIGKMFSKAFLAAGQQLVVDTGNVAGFETSVSIDIQQVPGLKNKVLGGEGFFNTLLTGPGKVWLQTMPLSSLASALSGFIPSGN